MSFIDEFKDVADHWGGRIEAALEHLKDLFAGHEKRIAALEAKQAAISATSADLGSGAPVSAAKAAPEVAAPEATCDACHGTGKIPMEAHGIQGGEIPCPNCEGKGKIAAKPVEHLEK
jgi:DnaJ-class molecular chaperone